MYQEIFKQGKIGNITLKNRLVMSPMGTSLAEMDGSPSEDMIAFYKARAIGGAALIIPEIARVNDLHGAGMMRQLSVSKDRHIEGLAKLAETVHKYGTKIFIQLHHPGRETVTALTGGPVVSASAIPCKYLQQETRALSTEEVKALIQQFISGAVRVKKAGCDGVELHAAHGYLLQQFLSPYTNKREDEYGGSFENRLRMITEIINGIRVQCGPDFPIGVRLSVEEFLDKTGVTEDYIHIQDGVKIAMALEKSVKTPSFITAPEEMPNFGKISLMKNQEGIYLAYLTDPAAIAKVLPAPLKPFSVPVVTVSVCHVKEPTFADDYYEAILGVYCTYGTQLGLYPIGLVLGGTGAEMAVQCGRDNGSIPKKLGSEFVIRRNNDHVTAQVCRRGTELVNIDLKIGEYNNAMTGMLYQFPEAGKKTYGGGFYFHLDREPDKEGKSHFQNGALLQNLCEYNYHSWEPGFAAIKLQSSIDDPWGELPIRTVIGGAYSSNDLMVHKLNLCEEIDADVLAPYLLTARYDRTAFMETGRR